MAILGIQRMGSWLMRQGGWGQRILIIGLATLSMLIFALPSQALDYNRGNLVGADFSHQDLH